MFLYCFCGKIATENCERMADALYESNWHDLPNDLQQYFVIMIGNAQQPLCYHGSGLLVLNLETFTKVRTCHIHEHFFLVYD